MGARDVVVVGAGPSGLGAAFRLQQAGWRVRLLERGPVPGGRFTTQRRAGFLLDQGAQVIPSAHDRLLAIVDEAGLGGELVDGGSVLAFARGNELNYLDTNRLMRDGFRFPQVSWRSKLRLANLVLDVAKARRALSFDDLDAVAALDRESAGEYARRRLGTENHDFLIDTAMRGMLATPADTISTVDLFFGLSKFIGVTFVALRDGNGSYGEALAARFDTRLGADVGSVIDHGDHVTVDWSDADGQRHSDDVAGCVLAVPAPVAARLHPGMDPWRRAFLEAVPYSTSVSVSVALDRPPAGVPASLVFIPRAVHPGLIGLVLDHNKAPGRVPDGRGLVSGYAETHWARELADEDDDRVAEQMIAAIDSVVGGVADQVSFTEVRRWRPTAMYAGPGYYREYRRFDELSRDDRRVRLAGDYAMTSNVNTATRNGETAARRLVETLNAQRDR